MAEIDANLDGTRTEYFAVECSEAVLLALLRDLFEKHWPHATFGPCIEGAVFEGRFRSKPTVSLLDGYVTVQVDGDEGWHFHLCIGPNRGSAGLPTPPALALRRRCSRAAFFRVLDRAGRAGSWGLRLWNGAGEQMLTVFLPNPWIDPVTQRYVREPDWSRLDLWMRLRERFAGVPAEPPPVHAQRPVTH